MDFRNINEDDWAISKLIKCMFTISKQQIEPSQESVNQMRQFAEWVLGTDEFKYIGQQILQALNEQYNPKKLAQKAILSLSNCYLHINDKNWALTKTDNYDINYFQNIRNSFAPHSIADDNIMYPTIQQAIFVMAFLENENLELQRIQKVFQNTPNIECLMLCDIAPCQPCHIVPQAQQPVEVPQQINVAPEQYSQNSNIQNVYATSDAEYKEFIDKIEESLNQIMQQAEKIMSYSYNQDDTTK